MFKIDPTSNRISPLEVKRFSDLGFTERKHLQEWLGNYPQALAQSDGEELLIIQKEFDGFEPSSVARGLGREQLDLLAIDKEVTNTILWLSQFGVNCQCFKVTPYQAGTELFLNVEQIIPTPEALDFMIGMMAKEAEEKSVSNEQRQSHWLRQAFWEQALDAFGDSSCNLYNNISPGKDHWLAAGSGLSGSPCPIERPVESSTANP